MMKSDWRVTWAGWKLPHGFMSQNNQPGSSYTAQCEGWWERGWEKGAKRRRRLDLPLQSGGEDVWGRGRDMVGFFTLRGPLDGGGGVVLMKPSLGNPSVKSFARVFPGVGLHQNALAARV